MGSALEGRDLFAALPTGGGKSLCYQLPALHLPSLTVVISPLIALMEDQVRGARANGLPAAFLNSTLGAEEARQVYRDVSRGSIRLLYLSPERLARESFRATLREWGVSLFAVDEAHCISEWGHEFRPDYRTLETLRRDFPEVAINAYTATATRAVQEDVIRLLGLRNPLIIRADFDRPEIFYRVRRKKNVSRQILSFVKEHQPEPGIVYRATRKAVEETTQLLRNEGIAAVSYHAGLADTERRAAQEQFVQDEAQVVVATIAFGMGIDKSNVRWILHGDLPRSLEAYYQETGRAGRDGEPAEACLFYGPEDVAKIRYHLDRMQTAGEKERGEQALRTIMRFVDAGVCRRTRILLHFGQEHTGNCGRCDVCTGEVKRIDLTVEARKAMSAIARTGEFFGSHHLVDILLGEETEKILERRHHHLPTFGVGSDRDRAWWLALFRDLEAAGLLRRRDGPRSGLELSDSGRDVLYGRKTFLTSERESPPTPAGSRIRGTLEPSPRQPGEEELFEDLRALRLRIAREKRIPPYVIFSDKTLRALARTRPASAEALLSVHGVGAVKAERYGGVFLQAIREFSDYS